MIVNYTEKKNNNNFCRYLLTNKKILKGKQIQLHKNPCPRYNLYDAYTISGARA